MTNIDECPNRLEVHGDSTFIKHFGNPLSAVLCPDGRIAVHYRFGMCQFFTRAAAWALMTDLTAALGVVVSPDVSGIAAHLEDR